MSRLVAFYVSAGGPGVQYIITQSLMDMPFDKLRVKQVILPVRFNTVSPYSF